MRVNPMRLFELRKNHNFSLCLAGSLMKGDFFFRFDITNNEYDRDNLFCVIGKECGKRDRMRVFSFGDGCCVFVPSSEPISHVSVDFLVY